MSNNVVRKTLNFKRVCVYCGTDKQITKDHIPPKCLFPKPRPTNLITVPSCEKCNHDASKDEEYFRLMISMRHDAGNHPKVQGNLARILGFLEDPKQIGFKQALYQSLGKLELFSSGGIFIKTTQGYLVDAGRLDAVAKRVVMGLYFREFKEKLPSDLRVVVYLFDKLASQSSDKQKAFDDLYRKVIQAVPVTIGEGVFSYWFQKISNQCDSGAWVLEFYESVKFLCFTVPIDKLKL